MVKRKNNKIKEILLVGAVLIIFLSLTQSILAEKLSYLYPQDYSYRSGLPLDKQIVDKDGKVLVKELYYYSTNYPFRDPNSVDVSSTTFNMWYGGISSQNVGFRYSVLKIAPGYSAASGKVQATLALTPILEGKQVITYDKDGNSVTTGSTYKYDGFSNVKSQVDYGVIINPNVNDPNFMALTFDKSFRVEKIYADQPYGFGGAGYPAGEYSREYSTALTSLKGVSDLSIFDRKTYDNVYTTTVYQYEKYPLFSRNSENKVVRNTSGVKSGYQLLNWVSLPYSSTSTDGLGRKISDKEYQFEVQEYTSCDAPNHQTDFLCIKPVSYTCQGQYQYSNYNPESQTIYDCDVVDKCFRASPTSSITKPLLASGLDENHVSSLNKRSFLSYDSCGNPISVSQEESYPDPIFGVISSSDPKKDNYSLSGYDDVINLEYDPVYKTTPIKATKFSVKSSEIDWESVNGKKTADVVTSSIIEGYGFVRELADPNGLVTSYTYDVLGRITQVAVEPDTLNVPTKMYNYDSYYSNVLGHNLLRIQERTKIANNKYVNSYHIYDGAGNYVQTQTLNGDNVLLNLVEYDVLGRVVSSSKTIEVPANSITFGVFTKLSPNQWSKMYYTYDDLGRVVKTVNFEGKSVTTNYAVGTSSFTPYSNTSVTDELNNMRSYISDSQGNLVHVQLPA